MFVMNHLETRLNSMKSNSIKSNELYVAPTRNYIGPALGAPRVTPSPRSTPFLKLSLYIANPALSPSNATCSPGWIWTKERRLRGRIVSGEDPEPGARDHADSIISQGRFRVFVSGPHRSRRGIQAHATSGSMGRRSFCAKCARFLSKGRRGVSIYRVGSDRKAAPLGSIRKAR
jgi:hypothetical protein